VDGFSKYAATSKSKQNIGVQLSFEDRTMLRSRKCGTSHSPRSTITSGLVIISIIRIYGISFLVTCRN